MAITTRTRTGRTFGAGTISCSTASPTITGVSTSFTADAVVGQGVFGGPIGAIIGYIASVNSTTSITLTSNASQTLSASSGYYFVGFAVTTADVPLSSNQIDDNFLYLNTWNTRVDDFTSANTAWKGVKRDGSGGFSAGNISVGDITATGLTISGGGLPVASGGTGQTTYTNGQILIGNTTGSTLTKTTLTGTANQITVTNGAGSITISTPQDLATSSNIQFGSLGVGATASGVSGEIRAAADITSYYSDERLKTNINLIENALDKVMTLRGVTYNANDLAESFGYKNKEKQVGVLAGDIQKVLPEAVKPAPFDVILFEGTEISKSGENYKTVQYEKLVPLLIEAIKELNAKVVELESK
jgi:hypothetical protein